MKDGGWIPLDKNLVYFLPRNRPYSILEAMFSFTKDVNENKEKSIIEYSRIWSWSRCKVRRFVTDLKNGKTGARHSPDRDETGARHEIRYIYNNLDGLKDRGKTGARQGQDRGKTVTINPNPNPNKHMIDCFEKLWERYPKKIGKEKALEYFLKTVKTVEEAKEVWRALSNYLEDRKDSEPKFIKQGRTWFNQWQDWKVPDETE